MTKTYKQIAVKGRKITGRAPKFNTKYFTQEEVKEALENNKYFSHVCVELGLMKKGSKSPFNALRNLHTLIHHYNLSSTKLGGNLIEVKTIKCPHCGRRFKYNLVKN